MTSAVWAPEQGRYSKLNCKLILKLLRADWNQAGWAEPSYAAQARLVALFMPHEPRDHVTLVTVTNL